MLIRFQVGDVQGPAQTAQQLARQLPDVQKAILSFRRGEYDEAKHKRYPKGDKRGGQFAPKAGPAGSQPAERRPAGGRQEAPQVGARPGGRSRVELEQYRPRHSFTRREIAEEPPLLPGSPLPPSAAPAAAAQSTEPRGFARLLHRMAQMLQRKPAVPAATPSASPAVPPAATKPARTGRPLPLLDGTMLSPAPAPRGVQTAAQSQAPGTQRRRASDPVYTSQTETPIPRPVQVGQPGYDASRGSGAAARARIQQIYSTRQAQIDATQTALQAVDKRMAETLRLISRQQGMPSADLLRTLRGHQEEYARVKAERDRYLTGFQDEVRKALAVPDPIQFRPIATTLDEPRKQAYEAGMPIFQQLVSHTNLTGRYGTVAFLKISAKRSHYQEGRTLPLDYHGQVKLGRGAGTRAVVHSLGHWLEAQNPKIHQAAVDFLERRVQGQAPASLRTLVGRSYRKQEFAQADSFIHPYIGKLYGRWDAGRRRGDRSMTEVIAMGLEYMAFAPHELARDPEMFDFIYDVMQGRFS